MDAEHNCTAQNKRRGNESDIAILLYVTIYAFSRHEIAAQNHYRMKLNREGGYWERHLIMLLTIYAKRLAVF